MFVELKFPIEELIILILTLIINNYLFYQNVVEESFYLQNDDAPTDIISRKCPNKLHLL